MRLEKVEQFAVHGLTVRTNNHDEMKTSAMKISTLWQEFSVHVAPHLQAESEVFGIYHQYESDHLGEFDVTAGATQLSEQGTLEVSLVESGEYLVFCNKGTMPSMVVELWQQIWAYFSNEHCEYKRAYRTDFEKYKSEEDVEIYIGVIPIT
nr:GyrI-like domain-containing protein [Vibrio sp. S9_S30]